MKILDDEIEKKIQNDIIDSVLQKEYDLAIRSISRILGELYANIPNTKRISYGRIHTIKVLSEYLYTHLFYWNFSYRIHKVDYNFACKQIMKTGINNI